MGGQKLGFLVGGEGKLGPAAQGFGIRLGVLAGGIIGAGQSQNPGGRAGDACPEIGQDARRIGIGQLRLALALQHRQAGPVRAAGEEGLVVGQAALPGAQPLPLDHISRDRACALRGSGGPRPIFLLGGVQGGDKGGGLAGRGGQRSKGKAKRKGRKAKGAGTIQGEGHGAILPEPWRSGKPQKRDRGKIGGGLHGFARGRPVFFLGKGSGLT